MKKIFLTSTGFENEKIKNKFLEILNKDPKETKILFIITAAIDVGSVRILSKCLDDLESCNIPEKNITIYDLHEKLSKEEIKKYDAIYVCGGNTAHLAKRMKEINFKETLNAFLENGGIYIGVSAGSVVASFKFPEGLNFIKNKIDVHCEVGSSNGTIENNDPIYLTNKQAIYITESEKQIFE